jgi:hypothetical protein
MMTRRAQHNRMVRVRCDATAERRYLASNSYTYESVERQNGIQLPPAELGGGNILNEP